MIYDMIQDHHGHCEQQWMRTKGSYKMRLRSMIIMTMVIMIMIIMIMIQWEQKTKKCIQIFAQTSDDDNWTTTKKSWSCFLGLYFIFDELCICLCIKFAVCFFFMRPMSKVWDPSFPWGGDIQKCQSGNRPLVCCAADERESQQSGRSHISKVPSVKC